MPMKPPGGGDEPVFGDGVGNGDRVRNLFEQVDHFSFEVQAVVHDQVGVLKRSDVASAGLVQVRVYTGSHQSGDLDAVSADVLDQVGEHVDGRGHFDLAALKLDGFQIAELAGGFSGTSRAGEGNQGQEGSFFERYLFHS